MLRFALIAMMIVVCNTAGETAEPTKNGAQKIPPRLAALIMGSPEDFIKHFDKNNDGYLTKDELPPRMAANFERLDANGDGKLNLDEVQIMLEVARERMGMNNAKAKTNPNKMPNEAQIQKFVDSILDRMDTNKDGKISKLEASGRVAEFFDQLDTNKDGFLDKAELSKMASRFLANQANQTSGGRNSAADFDSLDKNADGRLTRDELKGTTYLEKFDEIDTDKDGKINPKEFEAYMLKSKKDEGKKIKDAGVKK